MSSFGCGKKRQVQKVSNVAIYVSIPFEKPPWQRSQGWGERGGRGGDEEEEQQQQQQHLEVTKLKIV